MTKPNFMDVLEKRNSLVMRLMKALEHLPREYQFAIITSFMPLSELEALVIFQERKELE